MDMDAHVIKRVAAAAQDYFTLDDCCAGGTVFLSRRVGRQLL